MESGHTRSIRYDKNRFRSAYQKLVRMFESCDNETQVNACWCAVNNFKTLIEFRRRALMWRLVFRPWELPDYLSWTAETKILVGEIDEVASTFFDFIQEKRDEYNSQVSREKDIKQRIETEKAYAELYPKRFVVTGFGEVKKSRTKSKKS